MSIKLANLCEDFEDALDMGCPYVSPGNTSWSTIKNGVDCSGLFVAAFKKQGGSIYHGSNTMARKYTDNLTALSKASQLFPGAVVYKHLDDGGEPDKYKDDGMGDFVHVGLCTCTSPLTIIHASSAAGKVTSDSKIGKWAYFGKLKGVNYGVLDEDETAESGDDQEEVETMTGGTLRTLCTLNVRDGAGTDNNKIGQLTKGTELAFTGDANSNWVLIDFNGHDGYICTNPKRGYVQILTTTDEEQDEDAPVEDQDEDTTTDDGSQSAGELESRVLELEEAIASQTDIDEDIVSILRTLYQREGIEWPGIRHMATENITSYEADE